MTKKCPSCSKPRISWPDCYTCVNPDCEQFVSGLVDPVCPPPADSGCAAVVAHAAQSSSGVGTQADKPACRRGTCPADRMCLACEFPTDLSSRAGDLHSFQDFLISQKQSLSALPEMAEKVASIDAALHELDLFLFGEGLA